MKEKEKKFNEKHYVYETDCDSEIDHSDFFSWISNVFVTLTVMRVRRKRKKEKNQNDDEFYNLANIFCSCSSVKQKSCNM